MSDNDGDDLENKVENSGENISISNNIDDNASISTITIDISGNIEENNENNEEDNEKEEEDEEDNANKEKEEDEEEDNANKEEDEEEDNANKEEDEEEDNANEEEDEKSINTAITRETRSIKNNKFGKGDRIEGNFRGRGRWFKAKVNKVNRNNTYNIDYDDGERENNVEEENIRIQRSNVDYSDDSYSERLDEGTKVEGQYRGRGKWYPGVIDRKRANGTFDIYYDDGEREIGVDSNMIRLRDSHSSPRRMSEGVKVEVNYRGKGRWFPGRILRVRENGTYDVEFEDGDREMNIEEYNIRLLGEETRRPYNNRRIVEGMRVEGNYRGKGRWYPGKIARIRANGTYDINYDDGERELGIDINNIKVTDEEPFFVICDKCRNQQQIPSSKPNYVLCSSCRTRIKTPYAPRETMEEVEEKKRKEEEEKLENMHKTEFNRNLDDVENKTVKKDTLMRLVRSFEYNIEKPLSVDEKNMADKTIKNQYFYDYVTELGDNIPFIEYFYIIKHLENNYKSNSKKILEAAEKNVEAQIMQKQEENRLQQIEQNMRNKQRNVDTLNQDINIKRREEELKNEEQLNQYFIDMHLEQRKKEEKLREAENEIEIERRFLRIKEQKKDLYFQTKMLDYDDEMDLYDINTFNRYSSCCNYFCKQTIIDDFDKIYELIINLPSLTTYEKNLILIRFKAILTYCEKNYNVVSKLYNISRTVLMTCSIVNPALLSINNDANNPNYVVIYWVVWCSQILVSLITGYTGIFKWDKKNLIFNAYKTKINQEIWLYIELSGTHYKKINNSEEYSEYGECNHAIYLNKFLTRLEMFYTQLKCSELEIESKKDDDKGTGSNVSGGGNSRDEVRKAQELLKARSTTRR